MTAALIDPEVVAADEKFAAIASRADGIEQAIQLTDANNECSHGHLPHDPNPVCECWTLSRTWALASQRPLTREDYEEDHMSITGIPERQKARADKQRRAEEMYAYYEADESRSLADVGEKFGLNGTTVGNEFKRYGLKARPRGHSAKGNGARMRAAKRAESGSHASSTPAAPLPDTPPVKVQTPVATYGEVISKLEAEIAELTGRLEQLAAARDALKLVA